MDMSNLSANNDGAIYVITNSCLKEVEVPVGKFKGKLVSPFKIGRAKELPGRLGTLNTPVYENFVPRYVLKGKDIKCVEKLIHLMLQDYRISTSENNRTEFFACPLDEAIRRIRKLAQVLEQKFDVKRTPHKDLRGRSSTTIRANAGITQKHGHRSEAPAKTKAKPSHN